MLFTFYDVMRAFKAPRCNTAEIYYSCIRCRRAFRQGVRIATVLLVQCTFTYLEIQQDACMCVCVCLCVPDNL